MFNIISEVKSEQGQYVEAVKLNINDQTKVTATKEFSRFYASERLKKTYMDAPCFATLD